MIMKSFLDDFKVLIRQMSEVDAADFGSHHSRQGRDFELHRIAPSLVSFFCYA